MREILSLLAEHNPNIEEETLSDSQTVAIYEATTEEERLEYENTISQLLEYEQYPENKYKLVQAVSWLNMKCMLLENKLI